MSQTKQTKDSQAYQAAKTDWDNRIGQAKGQLRNWRLATMLSLLVCVLLIVALIVQSSTQKTYVYVAKVVPGQTLAHMQALPQHYTPTQAQRAAFIGRFIRNIMTLPLDPVVLRSQWLGAYAISNGQATMQLTTLARKIRPFSQVGQQTQTVHIQSYHVTDNNSYEFTWTVKTFNNQGKVTNTALYSGLFTVTQGAQSGNVQQLMNNPLGLFISFFNIHKEDNV